MDMLIENDANEGLLELDLNNDDNNIKINKLSENVWSAESEIGDPLKKVYFGFEKVDQQNKESWKQYARDSEYLVRESRSVIYYSLVKLITGEEIDFNENMKAITGFENKEDYQNFLDKMKKNGFNKQDKKDFLEGISGGIAGFEPLFSHDNMYVVYASKVPVTGKFDFPQKNENTTLKDFSVNYSNLIMSVGSIDYKDTPIYENRGIFRNPINAIEGDYKGVALKLHAFSAYIYNSCFKDKIYMQVGSFGKMTALLQGNMERGEMFAHAKSIKDYNANFPPIKHEFKGKISFAQAGVNIRDYQDQELPKDKVAFIVEKNISPPMGYGIFDLLHIIKIQALASKFNPS